ncbi:MAG: amino acid racemase [Desulfarculaceae bacterium]
MPEKVIGVLGGMGPEATVDFFAKIIANTPARKDQEHLRVVIDSNPKVPDRTAAILDQGASPLPTLEQGCQALEQAGADFIIIPCVTAHFFLDELKPRTPLPILSILDAVAEAIVAHDPPLGKVGLMGTNGTLKSRIFQKRLAAEGMEVLVCSAEVQQRVMDAIYHLKSAASSRSREQITAEMIFASQHLIDRGAQGIIAGCTEIPLALNQKHLQVPYFDSLLVLARAAIVRAGREPAPKPTS